MVQLDVKVGVGVVEVFLVVVEPFECITLGGDVDLAVIAVVGSHDLDLVHADVALVLTIADKRSLSEAEH